MSVLLFPCIFEMCDFHLSLLDLNFLHFHQENFNCFLMVLWKSFFFFFFKKILFLKLFWKLAVMKFWNLRFGKFATWDFERFETWNFEKLKLGILKICDFEILDMKFEFEKFFATEILETKDSNLKIRHWECGIF